MKDKRFKLFAQVLTIRYFMRFRKNDEDFIGATRPDVAMPTAKQYENLCLPCLRCMCVCFPLVFFNSPPPKNGSVRPSHPVIFILSTFTFTRQFVFAASSLVIYYAPRENPFPPRAAIVFHRKPFYTPILPILDASSFGTRHRTRKIQNEGLFEFPHSSNTH